MVQAIPEFFSGKDVFITGATGFMGKVLIEKLLRSCPNIGSIYVLVRGKKGKNMNERLEEMFVKPLFDRLKEERPGALKKVRGVEGDVAQLHLGLSDGDQNLLIEKVSVVFHMAASVRFDDSLKYAILMNVRGTREVASLCLKMKRLEVFNFVSTAYSNCDRLHVEEKLYPPYLDWRKAIDIAEKADEYTIAILSNKCLDTLPNTYVFSKSLAENVVNNLCQGLIPIVIFRPSIVTATYAEPVKGWIENFNGPCALAIGVTKGIIRTALMRFEQEHDFMSCDVAVKALVIAAWLEANKRCPDSLPNAAIYNCCSSGIEHLKMSNKTLEDVFYKKELVPGRVAWYPSCIFTSNYWLFRVLSILLQVIPALVVDFVLGVSGRKPKYFKFYKKVFVGLSAVWYFGLRDFKFENKNFLELDNRLLSEDRSDWNVNVFEINPEEGILNNVIGYKKYLLKEDFMTHEEQRRHIRRMYWLDRITRVAIITLLVWLLLKRFVF